MESTFIKGNITVDILENIRKERKKLFKREGILKIRQTCNKGSNLPSLTCASPSGKAASETGFQKYQTYK